MLNIKSYLSRIQKGATLNFLNSLSNNFGLAFAAYYFKVQGLELYKIILIWAITPLASLPIVFFINRANVKWMIQLGLLAYAGMTLSLLFYGQYSYIFFGIFGGFALGFFWPSANYVFFRKSTNSNYAKDSSIYFIIGPLISVILPPLGALLIKGFGYKILFLVTLLLALIPLLYVRGKAFESSFNQEFKSASKAFSGFRLITVFDASLHYFQGNFLAVYALLFLSTAYQVGGLLSYLALLSFIVSFASSYLSDKHKQRIKPLYFLLIAMSILIIVIPAIKPVYVLLSIIGLYAVLDNISLPIRFAIPMDFKDTNMGFWRASEFYCNVGRTVVFSIASLLLYISSKWSAFAIFAVMTFIFPFIISHQVKALKITSYE